MSRGPLTLRALRRLVDRGTAYRLGISLYPPYLGAGIACARATPDLRTVEITLTLRWYNRNFVGTHFGGSLFSMCDPHYMLMLLEALGHRCVVWDKAATIRYRRPGRGVVRAVFHLSQERLDAITAKLDAGARSLDETFEVQVVDAEGTVVAELEKVVYLRRKELPQG
ncbi:MAG: DUF4442 domain-containing protein [Alphaproteobacteria bacterium]|nr:DUF4442 domain-containing protein [Alphaproteobacteria bacterium]